MSIPNFAGHRLKRAYWIIGVALIGFVNTTRANWSVSISQQPSTNEFVGSQLDGMLAVQNDPGPEDLSVSVIALHGASVGVDSFSADGSLPATVAAGTTQMFPFHCRLIGAPGSVSNNVVVFVTAQLGASVSENKTATTQKIASKEAVTATLSAGDDAGPFFTGDATTVTRANQIRYRLVFLNSSDTPAQLIGLPGGFSAPTGSTESSRSNGVTTIPGNGGTSTWFLTVDVNDDVASNTSIVQSPTANYSMTNIALPSRPVLISPTNFTSVVRFATLTIQNLSPTAVRLLWPTNDTGFTLQTISNLASGVWSNVTAAPLVLGTNNVVTNTVSGKQRYYRLKF